jgi:predicted metal-dependent phosphoesterase TrpH
MSNTTAPIGSADLHMHTTASDGFYPVDQLLDYIAEHSSLSVIAITDHDEIDASLWAYAQRERYPFEVVPGVEVSSRDGHVLALWVERPIAPEMSLADTVAAIHAQGGIAVLAHPIEFFIHGQVALRNLSQPQRIIEAGVDAIEVHNGGAIAPFANTLARHTARQIGLPMLSNSDAHSTAAVGSGITRFEGHTAEDLRRAISTGATQAIDGWRWPLADYLRLFPQAALNRLPLIGTAKSPTPSPSLGGD